MYMGHVLYIETTFLIKCKLFFFAVEAANRKRMMSKREKTQLFVFCGVFCTGFDIYLDFDSAILYFPPCPIINKKYIHYRYAHIMAKMTLNYTNSGWKLYSRLIMIDMISN